MADSHIRPPRIAPFSDSYHEANGVARTTKAIEACAKKRNLPLLSVHAGPETRLVHDGSIVRLDLKRSRALSFSLEHDLRFDLSIWRHAPATDASCRQLRCVVVGATVSLLAPSRSVTTDAYHRSRA
jgi:hypothetical protein